MQSTTFPKVKYLSLVKRKVKKIVKNLQLLRISGNNRSESCFCLKVAYVTRSRRCRVVKKFHAILHQKGL